VHIEEDSMTRHPWTRIASRLRDAAGSQMVEAAIITPLLLLLTFAIMDFGGLFYTWLALENGVSQASRFGITGNTMDDPSNPGTPLGRTDSIMLAMRQATPTLTIDDSAFSFAHQPIGGSWTAGTGGPGDVEKVTVDYVWVFYDPLLRPFFPGGQLAIEVASSMKNESKFQ
jgi:hypothetical protein